MNVFTRGLSVVRAGPQMHRQVLSMTPPAGPHGIVAHYFCASDIKQRPQGALTVEDWKAGLDVYRHRLVPINEWLRRAATGRLGDAVAITFDDGLREALTYAKPVLDEMGLTAAWNIYTQPFVGVPHHLERDRWIRNYAYGGVEGFYTAWAALMEPRGAAAMMPPGYLHDRGYLTEDDRRFRYWRNHVATPKEYERVMEQLGHQGAPLSAPLYWSHWLHAEDLVILERAGHVIGLHTHQHPTVMDTLSVEAQRVEMATCRWILQHMGLTVTTGAYPCGELTEPARAWCEAHGIRMMWGATMQGSYPWSTPRWSTGYWR